MAAARRLCDDRRGDDGSPANASCWTTAALDVDDSATVWTVTAAAPAAAAAKDAWGEGPRGDHLLVPPPIGPPCARAVLCARRRRRRTRHATTRRICDSSRHGGRRDGGAYGGGSVGGLRRDEATVDVGAAG